MSNTRSHLELIEQLTTIGAALSAERDHDRLMERILDSARDLTGADGGTIYTLADDESSLRFEILMNDSLDLRLGGTSGAPIDLPPLPLRGADGTPNHRMVAAYAALTGETVNIPDAHTATGFDFSGTRDFDRRTGYRSTSFLTVPLRDHVGDIIGVLQLINARNADDDGQIVPFTVEEQRLVESLASQAAIAMSQKRLVDDHRRLFESFVEVIAKAIDDKSPFTGNHCRRVPILTMLLADAAAEAQSGPLASFTLSPEERYELEIAAWLHDCGKVSTPDYVVDKATKLQKVYDRIELIRTRYAVLRAEAESAELVDELRFLERVNLGVEQMTAEDQARVHEIARRRWRDADGVERPLLTDDEVANLTIPQGTLTDEERAIVKHHVVTSIEMLESLPYPKHLRRIPELAGGHHERIDGKGYPRGLRGHEMPVGARIMAIADIFEALTAKDRPYRRPMMLSEALALLGRLKQEGHLDPDLVDIFIRKKVYLRYAEEHLEPSQIDKVEEEAISGDLP